MPSLVIKMIGKYAPAPRGSSCWMKRGKRGLNESLYKTRPDTRLPKSRAGAQGPYLRSADHLGRSSEVK